MSINNIMLRVFSCLVFLIITIYPCAIFAKNMKSEIFTARGMTLTEGYRAQENTLDAILGVKKWNIDHPNNPIVGSENHVVVVKPQTSSGSPLFVCSHDENLMDLTGQNLNLHHLSKQQIENLNLLQVLYGIDYGHTRKFNYLYDILEAAIKDKPITIWLGVKDHDYRPTPNNPSYTAYELIKALQQWRTILLRNHHVDLFDYLFVSSTNPFIVSQMLKAQKEFQVVGLKIIPDYSDCNLPKIIWSEFFEWGGYEKLFDFSPALVSIQDTLLSPELIDRYHQKNTKVICWGSCDDPKITNNLDIILKSY